MPMVIIKTGITGADGYEEQLGEYLCDSPNCHNFAVHVAVFVKELNVVAVFCEEHARKLGVKI
ncbi:MAG: hypothetical protein DMG61_02970 [Acidobacteria bacterium]|nr:MAG: hypothetical protein DMG61_02970 [Acidobacteriota bacterium]